MSYLNVIVRETNISLSSLHWSDNFYTINFHCRNCLLDAKIEKRRRRSRTNKIEIKSNPKQPTNLIKSHLKPCIYYAEYDSRSVLIYLLNQRIQFTSECEERLIYCFNSSKKKFLFCIFYSMDASKMSACFFSFFFLLIYNCITNRNK